jgi:uncharacterized protein (DUF433 family)
MADNNIPRPDRLDAIESRVRRLEEMIEPREMREAVVEPWQYLVRRQHPWRKQLYIKGRNLTARQLVGSTKANHLDEEAAAADHRLPVEAVREALAYVESNRDLLETEAEIERLMLMRGGIAPGPQPVNQFTTGLGDYTVEREQLFGDDTLEQILGTIKAKAAEQSSDSGLLKQSKGRKGRGRSLN